MKKIMQRFLGIAAAAALIVTYAVPVMAVSAGPSDGDTPITETPDPSNSYTITLKETETEKDGSYGAYQIFSGTVKGKLMDGNPIPENPGNKNTKIPITDIKWGNAFGDVTEKDEGTDGLTGQERWQKNIVKFVYALATASDETININYYYAFKDFTSFKSFAGNATDTLDAKYYTDSKSTHNAGDYGAVDFEKLAVDVAEELSNHQDRKWLQQFADILGGYADKESSDPGSYHVTGYVERYYASKTGTEDDTYTITVPAGYYMIREFSDIELDDEALSARLLFVANNITQTLKTDVPTLTKSIIRPTVDSGYSTSNEWKTEAAGVGDTVTFQLTATLPNNYDNFLGGYKFTFEDTLSKGLNYDDGSVNITVLGAYLVTKTSSGEEVGAWYDEKPLDLETNSYSPDLTHVHFTGAAGESAYTVTSVDGVLTVDFPCLKEIRITDDGKTYRLGYNTEDNKTSKIYVTYTATVDNDAVVYPADRSASDIKRNGNLNSAVLTYSDNPQAYAQTDTTTSESATVYTYGLTIDKVDAANFIKNDDELGGTDVALENAKFALVRENPDATANNYQIATFVNVAATSEATDPFGGTAYQSVNLWQDITGTATLDTLYSFVTTYVTNNPRVAATVTSDANGSIKISGLNDGVTYYLVEVAPPDVDTYATIDPFTLTLTAEIDDGEYTGLLAKEKGVEIDKDETSSHEITTAHPLSIDNFVQIIKAGDPDTNGIAELIVANFKYVDLPSTGGTGTYIFYIIGGVVVAASLVLFFLSRKKTTK